MSSSITTPPELLTPCPFCGGPPVPFIGRGDHPWGWLAPAAVTSAGTWASAHVFCHECGSQGPHVEDDVHDAASYHALLALAVRQWQERDDRNGDLYRSNTAEGRSLFPRADEALAP